MLKDKKSYFISDTCTFLCAFYFIALSNNGVAGALYEDDKFMEVSNMDIATPEEKEIFRPDRVYPFDYEQAFKEGKFNLIKGAALPVCRAYLDYLEKMRYMPYSGAQCYRWYLREHAGISRPAVEILAEPEATRLLWQVSYYLSYGEPDIYTNYSQYKYSREGYLNQELLEELVQTKKADIHKNIWLMKTDINNDGSIDDLLLVREGLCRIRYLDGSRWSSISPVVWDKENNKIDGVSTLLIYDTDPAYKDARLSLIADENMHTVFEFEGESYFDRNHVKPELDTKSPPGSELTVPLYVYQIKDNEREELCEYEITTTMPP